jgi:hypothetical protein
MALLADVIVGATPPPPSVTVRVKFCEAFGVTPFDAAIVKGYVPTKVVPAIVMSPLELSMLTPEGAPVSEKVIADEPLAVTWNVPPTP